MDVAWETQRRGASFRFSLFLERSFREIVEKCYRKAKGNLGPALELTFSELCESDFLLDIVEPMIRNRAIRIIQGIRRTPRNEHIASSGPGCSLSVGSSTK